MQAPLRECYASSLSSLDVVAAATPHIHVLPLLPGQASLSQPAEQHLQTMYYARLLPSRAALLSFRSVASLTRSKKWSLDVPKQQVAVPTAPLATLAQRESQPFPLLQPKMVVRTGLCMLRRVENGD